MKIKIKTSELIDGPLDWAVAKAADYLSRLGDHWMVTVPGVHVRMNFVPGPRCSFTPSTRWAQGGPIIERERIDLVWQANGEPNWSAYSDQGASDDNVQRGSTPLIAAMRCFVASRLGDEVDIPKELQ